jgi:hypothetical protein
VKTQVATDLAVTTDGVPGYTKQTSTDNHGRVTTNWTTGVFCKVNMSSLAMYEIESLAMYEIEWDTKPNALYERKTANEVQVLVDNFKYCCTYKLLQGYVGLDLLWERQNTAPKTLQHGYVMPFNPQTNMYKVIYRDGLWSFKSEQDILRAKI